MEDLKNKLNDVLGELSQKFSDIIDEFDTVENIISWYDAEDILGKLDEDDVAEWLGGRLKYRVVDFGSRGDKEDFFEELQAELGRGNFELTDTAQGKPWKEDCVTKINELADQLGWQGLLTKLENL